MLKKLTLLSILVLNISNISSSENNTKIDTTPPATAATPRPATGPDYSKEITKRRFIAGVAQGTLSAPFAPWVIGCCIGDAFFNLNEYAKGKKFDPLNFKNYAQEAGFATSFIPLSYLTYRKIFRLIRR